MHMNALSVAITTFRASLQELEQLRAAAAALKQDVDLMRANQEKQREQEEQLVLRQLKKTVRALQAEGEAISDQQHAVCTYSLSSAYLSVASQSAAHCIPIWGCGCCMASQTLMCSHKYQEGPGVPTLFLKDPSRLSWNHPALCFNICLDVCRWRGPLML